jgi:hypothetical protein
VHWHSHGGTAVLAPLDSDDSNGTPFAFSTSTCVTSEPTNATGTPAILWHYDAGELVISFMLVVLIAFAVFRGLIHVFK